MTNEEAARILNPATSAEALRPYALDCVMRMAVVEEACRMGAEALRASGWISVKDGRLVVLPCKAGDTVWFKTFKDNGKTCIGMQPHNVAGTRVCVMAEGKFFPVELPLGGLGKQWFLTREEAEKALEAKQNG